MNLIPILQHAITRYLALDPETLKRLGTLTGQVVKLELTDLEFACYLYPSATGLKLSQHHSGVTNATIRGSSLQLLRTKFAAEADKIAAARELKISGDAQLAHTFSQILQQIDIDWEEQLSQVTGDIIAHQIGNLARGFKRWRRLAVRGLSLNVTEYLQEEAQQLPTRQEVEDFFAEVDELRHDCERVAARFKQL